MDDLKTNPLDSFNLLKCDPGAFAGGTTNARGDKDGTKAVMPLFKINGTVLLRIFGVCKETLVGATGTVEVGVAGNTASLLAQITASDLITGEIWNDASPTTAYVGLLSDVLGPYIVSDIGGTPITIDEKVATADLTAGGLFYVCLWRALTPGANVESLFAESSV